MDDEVVCSIFVYKQYLNVTEINEIFISEFLQIFLDWSTFFVWLLWSLCSLSTKILGSFVLIHVQKSICNAVSFQQAESRPLPLWQCPLTVRITDAHLLENLLHVHREGEGWSMETVLCAPLVLNGMLHYLWVILFSLHSCYWDPTTVQLFSCSCCRCRLFLHQTAVFMCYLFKYVIIFLLKLKLILLNMFYDPGLL